jgi:hypothetical protein
MPASSPASSSLPRARTPLADAAQFVRRSRSLASMLPPLLVSGIITLVTAAAMRLGLVGMDRDFFRVWMETWLTAWPFAFRAVYLAAPLLGRFAARIGVRSGKTATRRPR